MTTLIGSGLKLYSFPLGETHKQGYEGRINRTVEVTNGDDSWSGFVTVGDNVLTTNFSHHEEKEFDIKFKDKETTSGFLTEDWGDIVELGVGDIPKLIPLTARFSPVKKGETLYILGNFFGNPFEFASFTVDNILFNEIHINEERFKKVDMHSCGSPIYGQHAELVGMLLAYITDTDRIIAISLSANQQGVIKA